MASKLDLKKLQDKCKTLVSSPKKVKIIVLIGLIGMALICLSECNAGGDGNISDTASLAGGVSNSQYVADLETRLVSLIQSIDGVGKAQVMVTLEQSTEYVYEKQEKQSLDESHDSSGENSEKSAVRQDYETNTILVDGENGKEALLTKQMEPVVKGVVVVCQGGENVSVKNKVIQAVTTVLNLSSNRVFVTKSSY